MNRLASLAACLVLSAITACDDGGGFNCNLDAATDPADSDWPLARRDPANTGRIEATVASDLPATRCVFPRPAGAEAGAGEFSDCAIGGAAIDTTPIIGTDRMLLATGDGRVHVLSLTDGAFGEIALDNPIMLSSAANTPLLGADNSIFVTESSVSVRRFDGSTGMQMFAASLLADIVVPPNIAPSGVILAGSVAGLFQGTCTNGAIRFRSAFGGVSVAAAVTANPQEPERAIVLGAGDNGRLQAFDEERGNFLWAFFTANRLDRSAVVIDESRELFILPDAGGNIYAGSLRTGRPRRADGAELFPYRVASCLATGDACTRDSQCGDGGRCVGEAISASGALGRHHFYVATTGPRSETGVTLGPGSIRAYSLDFDGSDAVWTWRLPEGGQANSSPIVAVDGDGETLIAAADLDCDEVTCTHSVVLALRDGELLWQVPLPDPVGRAAPSIRRTGDGAAIYLGTVAGKLYEIR